MTLSMKIIDLSAGRRAIWYNKTNPLTTFVDVRPEVDPDIVLDTRTDFSHLGKFDLIVWDPPHMNCGPNSNMGRRYGHWPNAHIRELIKITQAQATKIAHENTLLSLKWNNHDIKLETVFNLMDQWEPLFGHMTKNGPHSQTFWVMMKLR